MPVTINTLSSTVSVGDGAAGPMPNDAIEQIVRIVLQRLRDEEAAREQQRIPERMSESMEM